MQENDILEQGDLTEPELDEPNEITVTAITEGRKIVSEAHTTRYLDVEALKKALEA